jgi:uncharacterized RDD family membrane protein YckC
MTSEFDRGAPSDKRRTELTLARWSTRFWAWLIDFIIVTSVFEVIFAIGYTPLAIVEGLSGSTPPWLGGVRYAIQSLMFFAYWTYFESTSEQSIGKRLLKIKTTDLAGNMADARSVAIQSFGKAFLLPIDVFFGWIFTNDKRQRIFHRASDTIVIKTQDIEHSGNLQHRKE